jgi:DNA polymerase-1
VEALAETDPDYAKRLKKLRKIVKRVVFGTLYGAYPKKIANIVGIPEDQAAGIIRSLFKMFPTIEKYIEQTKEQVRYLGVVETFIGRRRRFDLKGMTRYMSSKAERQAVNFKIQSTSSDIVLGVLCDMMAPLEQDFRGRMLITVHDSVVFDLPKEYISQMPDFMHEYGVKRVAEQYPWLPVPFKWDVEVGPSYGELVSVNNYLNQHGIPKVVNEDDFLEQEIRQDFEEMSA